MSTFRTPVGPQPASVYWKRRLFVGLGLLAVVVVILLIVFRPAGEPEPPAASASASPTPTATGNVDAEGEACAAGQVELVAVTDKGSYQSGEQPLISMSITNTGDEPCTINAGTDAQEYRITSGSDPIWNSRDCQVDAAATETVLQPGIPKSTTPFPWDRTRSSTSTCDAERPPVVAGGATYKLTVVLGELESAEAVAFLLF